MREDLNRIFLGAERARDSDAATAVGDSVEDEFSVFFFFLGMMYKWWDCCWLLKALRVWSLFVFFMGRV